MHQRHLIRLHPSDSPLGRLLGYITRRHRPSEVDRIARVIVELRYGLVLSTSMEWELIVVPNVPEGAGQFDVSA